MFLQISGRLGGEKYKMNIELAHMLLKKLDKKSYSRMLNKCKIINKKACIPGFSSIDRAPLSIVLNYTNTNPGFLHSLMDATASVLLDQESISIMYQKTANELLNLLTPTNDLGIAALLILKNDSECDTQAKLILDSHIVVVQDAKDTTNLVNTQIEQEKRKAEKHKEKYEETRRKFDELSKDYKKIKFSESELIERLKKAEDLLGVSKNKTFVQEKNISEYKIRIVELEKSLHLLKETTAKAESTKKKILAIGCFSMLSTFQERMDITDSQRFNLRALNANELFNKYDEVWAVSNLLTISMYRILSGSQNRKIHIFRDLSEMISYANKI